MNDSKQTKIQNEPFIQVLICTFKKLLLVFCFLTVEHDFDYFTHHFVHGNLKVLVDFKNMTPS